MFVNFGQSSGMMVGFSMQDLATHGSLSANRPVLFDYIATPPDLLRRSQDLFARILCGALRLDSVTTLPLQDAAKAHIALEARQTTGATVLLP